MFLATWTLLTAVVLPMLVTCLIKWHNQNYCTPLSIESDSRETYVWMLLELYDVTGEKNGSQSFDKILGMG